MHFVVGFKQTGTTEHIVLAADDALNAALKAKIARPEALIMYVRARNRRGNARHPPRMRSESIP